MPSEARGAWRFYFACYEGAFRGLFYAVVSSVIQCLLILPIAFLVRHAFDVLVPSRNVQGIVLIGLALVVMHTLNSLSALWVRHATLRVTKRVIQRLREQLLEKCYALSRDFYCHADWGRLHASIVQDTERVDCMSNALVALFLPAVIISTGLCGVLAFLNPVLFLAMLVVTPPLLAVGQFMKRHNKQRVQAFHRSFEAFSQGMLFVIRTMDLTRLQSAEAIEIHTQKDRIDHVRRSSTSMAWLTSAYATVQKGISTLSGIVILVVGGIWVANGSMTVGAFISFYVAAALLNHYVGVMLTAMPQMIEGREALQSVYDLLHLDAPLPYRGTASIVFSGTISLESVDFAYGETPVLREISLTIRPGEITVIVGPNGSGKTTLLHLILGFYRPKSGRLLAEGRPYNDLDMPRLRKSIGMATQNPNLFPGTILENITYGSPEVSMEEVVEAATLARAHAFIEHLPEQFETPVGEDGVLLSGGQRQRIAIARALFRQPRLLILDEPTTHLDAEAISSLLATLRRLDWRPAILCVTHDPQVATLADAIYQLGGDGRVTHAGGTAASLGISDSD